MSPGLCPDPRQLSAYTHGELPETAADEVADHLETCPACEETVRNLERKGDTFVELLRTRPVPDPYLDEPQCEKSLSSLRLSLPLAVRPVEACDFGIIRDYELLEKLGEGGMGSVFKARHLKLKRLVALKVLPKGRLHAAAVARFEREMEAAGKVRHENIVAATDAGEHDGTHFLVMEYVEGRDLSQLVSEQGPLAIADACEIIRQAALGLHCAHEHGLVHRDVKPSNLMVAVASVEPSGRRAIGNHGSATVKVLDLGLALLEEPQSARELTSTGQVMGTIDYLAPEQAADAHRVDARADVYALGATLYKLLTGVPVYHGPACMTTLQKLHALTTQPAPSIVTLRPDVPAELSTLIHRLLAKDPSVRPQTALEVAQRLEPFAVGHNLAALLAPAGTSASRPRPVAPRPISAAEDFSRVRAPHGIWSRPRMAVGAGFSVLVILAAVLLAIWLPRNEVQPTRTVYAQVTGSTAGYAWGTDDYTTDSNLGTAAVHAGTLRPGETGTVKLTFWPGRPEYRGSTRNGITSLRFGSWPQTMRIEPAPPDAAPQVVISGGSSDAAGSGQVAVEHVCYFQVTGASRGFVWGTDLYTTDSDIGTAAVHAGVLRPGDTGIVKVTFLAGRPNYQGSARNGVFSHAYGPWPTSMRLEAAPAGLPSELVAPVLTAPLDRVSPGNFDVQPGQSQQLEVTGRIGGAVWGTDVYSTDSDIATAAVHAGVLKPGESGLVKLTYLPGQSSYSSSTRHGVTSLSWGRFPLSYQVERAPRSQPSPTRKD